MTPEVSDYTWQTLYEYIERRIAGVLRAIQFLREAPRLQNVGEAHTTGFEHELEILRSSLSLVREMQNRESLQSISPFMSLDLIRLRCRPRHAEQDNNLEFAWISPIAAGRYRMRRMGRSDSQESEKLSSFDADLIQIVDEVEKLVKETCAENHQ